MAEPTHPPEDELAKKAEEAQKEIAAKNAQHPEANAEHKEEKQHASTLESFVNETFHLGKTALNLGLAAGIPFAQASAYPSLARDTYVLSASQLAGDATTDLRKGKKFTSFNALESIVQGTILTHAAVPMFDLINKIPTNDFLGYVTKGAAWGGLAYPAYFGIYQIVDYLVKNRKFKGLGTYLKENYWTALKNGWKRLLPLSLLNIFFVPPYLQLPIGALLSYGLTLFGAPKKGEIPEEKKRDKTPYYVAAPTVAYKLARNSVKGLYDAVYAIGSSISDLYKTAPKKPAPGPAPSLAPAPA